MGISIFKYTNYRLFLADFYNAEKERKPDIVSYRYLSQKLEYKSPSQFLAIVEERANISKKKVLTFTTFFKFDAREIEYFTHLVHYNQAKSTEEKQFHYNQLITFTDSKFKKIDEYQYEFFDHWYYGVIRELIALIHFDGDIALLKEHLLPSITDEEIERALEVLKALEMIEWNEEQKRYVRNNPVITTGKIHDNRHLLLYNMQILDLIRNSTAFSKKGERLFSSLTFSCSEKTFKKMVTELSATRKKLISMAMQDEGPERVYQMSISALPVTKR